MEKNIDFTSSQFIPPKPAQILGKVISVSPIKFIVFFRDPLRYSSKFSVFLSLKSIVVLSGPAKQIYLPAQTNTDLDRI